MADSRLNISRRATLGLIPSISLTALPKAAMDADHYLTEMVAFGFSFRAVRSQNGEAGVYVGFPETEPDDARLRELEAWGRAHVTTEQLIAAVERSCRANRHLSGVAA